MALWFVTAERIGSSAGHGSEELDVVCSGCGRGGDRHRGFHPWTRITSPEDLVDLYARAGAGTPLFAAEPGVQPLSGPDDRWTIVLGSGYRATVERLGEAAAERVRVANLARLEERGVREIETNVVYGIGTRL